MFGFEELNKLREENKKLKGFLSANLVLLKTKFEELNQSSIYLISIPDATERDIKSFMDVIDTAKKMAKWTAPETIIINKKIKIEKKEK